MHRMVVSCHINPIVNFKSQPMSTVRLNTSLPLSLHISNNLFSPIFSRFGLFPIKIIT